MTDRPSEVAITLAVVSAAHRSSPGGREGWVPADIVRVQLGVLGINASAQQVAAWLGAMTRADMPWVEAREAYGYREYRVTHHGTTDVHNRFPGWSPRTPWLPVYRGGT